MGSEKHSNQRSNYPQTLLDIKCFNFRFVFFNQSDGFLDSIMFLS